MKYFQEKIEASLDQMRQAASSVMHICDPPFGLIFLNFFCVYTDKVTGRE